MFVLPFPSFFNVIISDTTCPKTGVSRAGLDERMNSAVSKHPRPLACGGHREESVSRAKSDASHLAPQKLFLLEKLYHQEPLSG
jgi:hypothetical protein